jgi:hypothetical protein
MAGDKRKQKLARNKKKDRILSVEEITRKDKMMVEKEVEVEVEKEKANSYCLVQ